MGFYAICSTYPDVLLHVLVTSQEAVFGFSVHGYRIAHGDRFATDHVVEQLGLAPQGGALVGDVDAV